VSPAPQRRRPRPGASGPAITPGLAAPSTQAPPSFPPALAAPSTQAPPTFPPGRRRLLRLVVRTLSNGSFFFATQYDATLTCQRIAQLTAEDVAAGRHPFPAAAAAGGDATLPAPDADAAALLADARAHFAGSAGVSPLSCAAPAGSAFLPARRYALSRSAPFGTTSLAESDGRLMWNRWMLGGAPDGFAVGEVSGAAACTEPLLTLPGIAAFVPPVAQGFVVSRPGLPLGPDGGARVSLTVISRRACAHVGTRFFTRGLDAAGSPANSAETEQIVVDDAGAVTSFVQLRGSIPVLWDQRPSLRWTPKVSVASSAESLSAFRRHVDSVATTYPGPVLAVCLVDRKGDQQMLGDAFGRACLSLGGDAGTKDGEGGGGGGGSAPAYDTPEEGSASLTAGRWSYLWFDFHAECRGMRWGNLRRLLAAASHRVNAAAASSSPPRPGDHHSPDLGCFRAVGPRSGGAALCHQRGVTRTNCMDNLDRTNVVQSLFARRAALLAASARPWAPGKGDPVSLWAESLAEDAPAVTGAGLLATPHAAFERAFMNAWADNADAMSILYSGTRALKTDFTRTGRTTASGRAADGWHAVSRWMLGNFEDGRTQDAWDVVTGAVRFARASPADAAAAPPASRSTSPARGADAPSAAGGGAGPGAASRSASAGASADGEPPATAGAGHGGSPPTTLVRPRAAQSGIAAHTGSVTPGGFLLRALLGLAVVAAATASATAVAHGAAAAAGAPGGAASLPWPLGPSSLDTRDHSGGLLAAAVAALTGAVLGGGGTADDAAGRWEPRLTTGALLCGGAAALLALALAGGFAMKQGFPSAVVEPAIRRLAPRPRFDRKSFTFKESGAGLRAKMD